MDTQSPIVTTELLDTVLFTFCKD